MKSAFDPKMVCVDIFENAPCPSRHKANDPKYQTGVNILVAIFVV
jgi:hypothetical protein